MQIDYYPLERIVARYEPSLSSAVIDAVRSGRYLRGECVAHFEEEWAEYTQTKYCLACANGLDALTLVLMAWKEMYRWADADEVIVPDFTFAATGLAVMRAHLTPVFCDVYNNALIDAKDAERYVSRHTRAIIGVHLYGRVCDVEGLRELKEKYGLLLLEDAAQAHGAVYAGRLSGSFFDAAAFSFYPGKNLGAIGDAGCITTYDAELKSLCEMLANYGASEKYRHLYPGLNSRMDEIQAAALSERLPYLEKENHRRHEIATFYRERINHPAVSLLPPEDADSKEVLHIFPLFTNEPQFLQDHLHSCGIETARHYPLPLHAQPAFASLPAKTLSVSSRLAATEVSIPIHPLLTDEEAEYICDSINRFTF